MGRWFVFLPALALALAACDDDGDGSGGGGGGGGGRGAFGECFGEQGQTCTGVDTYEACLQQQCGGEARACYGAGVFDGDFGGACAPFMQCARACDCGDTGCTVACAQEMSDACRQCSAEVSACTEGRCTPPVCTGGGNGGAGGGDAGGSDTGGGGGSGDDCAALAACCGRVDGSMRDPCQQIADVGNEASCGLALQEFSTLCPE
jgi:hypothetical protein